jgi:hypothetical protein
LHLSRFGEPVHLVSVAARQPAWVGPSWFAYWLGLKVPLTSRRMTLAAHITHTRSWAFVSRRPKLTNASPLACFFFWIDTRLLIQLCCPAKTLMPQRQNHLFIQLCCVLRATPRESLKITS